MAEQRDPRVDPRAGDVINPYGLELAVVCVHAGCVHFREEGSSWVTILDLDSWRGGMATAVVVHAAQEPAHGS